MKRIQRVGWVPFFRARRRIPIIRLTRVRGLPTLAARRGVAVFPFL
jgi:hypothetical protein